MTGPEPAAAAVSGTSATPKAERPIKHQRALSAMGWWKSLQPRTLDNSRATLPGDRATLAKLRRATTVFEVACEPAVSNLHALLKFEEPARDRDVIASAVLAGILSHIREEAKSRLAAAMGAGESPTVSPLRLRRFMAARDPDNVMLQFRRVLAMLDNKANIFDVALLALNWLDQTDAGDRARTRFAFAYHGHALAAPEGEEAALPPSDPETSV